jgi:hypothetical protein
LGVLVGSRCLRELSTSLGRHTRRTVIGNGRYTAVNRLDNPPRDAAAVASALRNAGFANVDI